MLTRWIILLTRPVAGAGALAFGGAALLSRQAPSDAALAYPALWWGSFCAAALALVALFMLPRTMSLRVRVVLLTLGGIAGAAFAGNGLLVGTAHTLASVGYLAALGLAVPTTVALLERAQHTPVRRL